MSTADKMNMQGVDASKPSSGFIAGRVYYATDTGKVYYDNGSALTAYTFGGSGGSPALSVSTKTTTYTITSSDDVILADATSGAFTISLPTAVGWTKRITILKIDSSTNAVTVGTTSSQTISGQSTRILAAQFSGVTLVSDNANWRTTEEVLPLTSKGDLLVGLAAHDLQRLAVGADGTSLVADSTQATGVKWGAPGALASASAKITAGDYTISTGSFAAVDATNLNFTITTGAHRVLITVTATGSNASANAITCLDVAIDGTRVGGTQGLAFIQAYTATAQGNISFSFMSSSLTAGSHTFELMGLAVAGTGTLHASTTNPLLFDVVELLA